MAQIPKTRVDEPSQASKAKIARYSDVGLSDVSWFRIANELTTAMGLMEPYIKEYWDRLKASLGDTTNELEQLEYSVANVHLMLAGFVVECLCKGFLARQLSPEERKKVESGDLPNSLKGSHGILEFVQRTGLSLAAAEDDLLKRITEAVVWRGRYPIPTAHERIKPYAEICSDVDRTKRFLLKLRHHVGAKTSYRI